MVTSKGDQTRKSGTLLGRTRLIRVSVRRAAQQEVVAFLNLLKRVRVIVPDQKY